MLSYEINVTEVEELQTLHNTDELDKIFAKAQRMIVGGGSVVLVRRKADGSSDKFDEFTTVEDLAYYKERVYKYLNSEQ